MGNGATNYNVNIPYEQPVGYVVAIAECCSTSGCEVSYGGYDVENEKFSAMISNNTGSTRSPYITIGCLLVKEEFYEYTTVHINS